jgi:hypothetical protein
MKRPVLKIYCKESMYGIFMDKLQNSSTKNLNKYNGKRETKLNINISCEKVNYILLLYFRPIQWVPGLFRG